MKVKKCASCPLSIPKYTKSGLCKNCYMRVWYHKNKDRIRPRLNETLRARQEKDPEWAAKRAAPVKRYRRNHREEVSFATLKRKYGMDRVAFYKLLNEQGGKCGICGFALNVDDRRKTHVDHDHSTQEVRGLLCLNCNTALGHFKESRKLLMSAIKYLERTPPECHPLRRISARGMCNSCYKNWHRAQDPVSMV